MCLRYFTWHSVFRAHSCCSIYQKPLPFRGRTVLRVRVFPILSVHFSVDPCRHLGYFCLLATVKMLVFKCLFESLLLFLLGTNLGIAGSCVHCLQPFGELPNSSPSVLTVSVTRVTLANQVDLAGQKHSPGPTADLAGSLPGLVPGQEWSQIPMPTGSRGGTQESSCVPK